MPRADLRIAVLAVALAMAACPSAHAQAYSPPDASRPLLQGIDFSKAAPISEEYRRQFTLCDGEPPNQQQKNVFRGFHLSDVYRCSTDPSRVRALLKLANGAVYWDSKMAVDVDGSWTAFSGTTWKNDSGATIRTTDLCGTWMKWAPVADDDDCKHPEAQIDPDKFPYIVIPTDGKKSITGPNNDKKIGAEFRQLTRLTRGDMGVVIFGGRWTPAFIADGGPFMRLGEASARVFEALGYDRCRGWNADHARCVGPGNAVYPYIQKGLPDSVLFIVFPGSGATAALTRDNAIARICAFAKEKLNLTGSPMCGAP